MLRDGDSLLWIARSRRVPFFPVQVCDADLAESEMQLPVDSLGFWRIVDVKRHTVVLRLQSASPVGRAILIDEDEEELAMQPLEAGYSLYGWDFLDLFDVLGSQHVSLPVAADECANVIAKSLPGLHFGLANTAVIASGGVHWVGVIKEIGSQCSDSRSKAQ